MSIDKEIPRPSKGDYASNVLKEYSKQNTLPPRSTSDLSPLEQWLIIQLYIRKYPSN